MKGGRRLIIGVGICVAALVLVALLFAPFPKPLKFTVQIPPARQAAR